MRPYILRAEGVDFDATLEDTQQLSAYRGGSLALLRAADDIETFLIREAPALGIDLDARRPGGSRERNCRIFSGASKCAFRFLATAEGAQTTRNAVEKFLREQSGSTTEAPHASMSYVVDVAEGEKIADLTVADARNRARQFRHSWPLPAFDPKATGVNPEFDRVRPADTSFYPPADDGEPKIDKASASFVARLAYGRRQRQEFYRTYARNASARLSEYRFTDDFNSMVEAPPITPDGEAIVSISLRNKIAVFYADGNKFGSNFRKATSLDAYSQLSRHTRQLQSDLLEAILDWLIRGAMGDFGRAFAIEDAKGKALRFETLLWGGDELIFVMPAWLGLDFLDGFLAATANWETPEGIKLTNSIGLVFCDRKTPIRQARHLARSMAEDAKTLIQGDAEDFIQIEAFESIAPPGTVDGLEEYRQRSFNTRSDRTTAEALRKAVTLSRVHWTTTLALLKNSINSGDEGLSRTQVYRLLRMAAKNKALSLDQGAEEADKQVRTQLDLYLSRVRDKASLSVDDSIPPSRPLSYALTQLAMLWDYAALPSQQDWPSFARTLRGGDQA